MVFMLILTSKKAHLAGKFGLQRVPRPLTLNLTRMVTFEKTQCGRKLWSPARFSRLTLNLLLKDLEVQGHRKYCDTCSVH